MKQILISFFLLSSSAALAGPTRVLDWDLKEFIVKTLASSRLAPHLRCSFKARDFKELRKFSSGSKWVESIEFDYRNEGIHVSSMKAYFPLGSKVEIETKNSEFAGPVEEIRISSGDRLDKTLIFQHDGRGQIVSMEMFDDLRVSPCLLRRP